MHFAGEDQCTIATANEQLLGGKQVAGQKPLLLDAVPNDKREAPTEPGQHAGAEAPIRSGQELGVLARIHAKLGGQNCRVIETAV